MVPSPETSHTYTSLALLTPAPDCCSAAQLGPIGAAIEAQLGAAAEDEVKAQLLAEQKQLAVELYQRLQVRQSSWGAAGGQLGCRWGQLLTQGLPTHTRPPNPHTILHVYSTRMHPPTNPRCLQAFLAFDDECRAPALKALAGLKGAAGGAAVGKSSGALAGLLGKADSAEADAGVLQVRRAFLCAPGLCTHSTPACMPNLLLSCAAC